MNQENQEFLGKEKISKLMLKFSIPCVLSLLVSALYNIVDQIFIGNSELSTLGNAATGVVFPIFIIAQAFAWCYGDGCAAYLNICQGRKDTKNLKKVIGTGLTITLITSIILIIVFYSFKNQILTLFGASQNSIGYAIKYFNIILAFFPIYMLSNMINAVLRADGNPKLSMISMLLGAVINIILDPLFIFAFKWGMEGAAWATVIGQLASFIVSLIGLYKVKSFKISLKCLVPNFNSFKPALKLGLSSFITQITIVIISLVCNIMLATYGSKSQFGIDIPIAIIGIESKVFTVVINLVVGIVLGCQPIISYNMGAKKYVRVKKIYRNILLCTLIIGLVSTLIFELAPNYVVSIFGKPTNIPNPNDYWLFGNITFRIFLMLVTFTCVIKMTSIFFQAVGKPGKAILASMIRDIVLFIPLIIIMPSIFGIKGILWAAPISDFLALIISIIITIIFFKSINKDIKQVSYDDVILKPSKPGVIITIAREHGSSGKEIGKLIAEEMNIPFYFKEVTALAAKESGLDQEFICDISNDIPNVVNTLYLSTNVVENAIIAQEKIIRKIADNGTCIIVGRAADYVLKDYKNVIKIFIHANMDIRIERVMKNYGDNEADAIKHIKKSDIARSTYYKNITGKEWKNLNNYTICIDSSNGIKETALTIVNYIKNLNIN